MTYLVILAYSVNPIFISNLTSLVDRQYSVLTMEKGQDRTHDMEKPSEALPTRPPMQLEGRTLF